jgi:hypothetical protein
MIETYGSCIPGQWWSVGPSWWWSCWTSDRGTCRASQDPRYRRLVPWSAIRQPKPAELRMLSVGALALDLVVWHRICSMCNTPPAFTWSVRRLRKSETSQGCPSFIHVDTCSVCHYFCASVPCSQFDARFFHCKKSSICFYLRHGGEVGNVEFHNALVDSCIITAPFCASRNIINMNQ